MEKKVNELRSELANYKAKEVGKAMIDMGYNDREANAVISMLGRFILQ